MTTTLSTNNGNRTVTIAYTANSEKVDTILANAAQELHNRGQGPTDGEGAPIAWGALTNAQKLAMIDAHVKRVIVNLAHAGNVRIQENAAHVTAQAENDTNTFD